MKGTCFSMSASLFNVSLSVIFMRLNISLQAHTPEQIDRFLQHADSQQMKNS